MKILKLLSLSALAIFISSVSADYGIYYGTTQKYADTLTGYDVMIVQPYNISLFKKYTGKKLCYISAGEFDGSLKDLTKLGLSGAVLGYNKDWNSYIMNMGSKDWQKYLISKENDLKNMGCSGLFVDTIWQDGQEKSGISIMKSFRDNWKTGYISVNNAHTIKDSIVSYVDAFMFENFWDKSVKDNSEDAKWLTKLSTEYKNIKDKYKKRIFALSYGDPKQSKEWGDRVKSKASSNGFEIIFSNTDLTKIY